MEGLYNEFKRAITSSFLLGMPKVPPICLPLIGQLCQLKNLSKKISGPWNQKLASKETDVQQNQVTQSANLPPGCEFATKTRSRGPEDQPRRAGRGDS